MAVPPQEEQIVFEAILKVFAEIEYNVIEFLAHFQLEKSKEKHDKKRNKIKELGEEKQPFIE